MTRLFTLLLCFLLIFPLLRAQKEIMLEDIWAKNTFQSKSVPGFNFTANGKHYLRLENNAIRRYDIATGTLQDTLLNAETLQTADGKRIKISGYTFSEDQSLVLLETDPESIYRYSKVANYYVYNRASKSVSTVHDAAKQMYAHLSPDGGKIAFIVNNNIMLKDLKSNKLTPVTQDGMSNKIINGAADWVYEEEFALTRAFEWSPDGKYLAFIKFDESEVPQFTMETYNDGMYPTPVTFKYPKVGEKNAVISLHIYNLATNKSIACNLGDLNDMYIPRIKWSPENQLLAFVMNRHQNHLQMMQVSPQTGTSKVFMEEKNEWYIDIHDDMTFLPGGNGFIWSSEQDGYQHLYWYEANGKLKKQLTSGNFDVTSFYGADADNNKIFYQAAAKSPMQREVYEMDIKSGKTRTLSTASGWNSAQFSASYDFYVLTHSTANTAPVIGVFNRKGEQIRTLENNQRMAELQKEYGMTSLDFFNFKTSEGVDLNGYMIKPADFDPAKKYPVFMFLYGGPNSQQVTDNWKGANYFWFQMLAQKGYIVACVDNRGTGARGQEFRKMTYLQLGKYETIDQIEAAKYLGKLPYADASRIGIFGWSYGGYMSSLCLLKGNDVFKAAIAVAPVTNWKWYDTVYTERYMRTEKENASGYKDNSPVYFADRLKGSYLLVHGMADDNVHFQHTVEMANALIKANKQFDTYFYPNRNHGIYGGTARLHLYTKMTDFIMKNI
ncbi:MAG: S9 family peptidase [Saprospiraceae bacterium]|nr:S9 family peptidase [Saprospiraceae bacterium]